MVLRVRCMFCMAVLCGCTIVLFTWYWLMNSRAADALFVELAESTAQMNQSRPKATTDLFTESSTLTSSTTTMKNYTEELVVYTGSPAPTKQLSLDYEKQTEEPLAQRGPPQHCESWCRRGVGSQPPYYLVAVLLVRIYYVDLAKLTTREMYQWLQYLRYAGVEHVYVYDAYRFQNESQLSALEGFIEEGYVTYTDWHDVAYPYGIAKTQLSAYQHCLNHYGKDSAWQTAIDIDEYPFSVTDTEQNFMRRFVEDFSSKNPHASEITMQNYLFLGKPLNDTLHPLLASRVWRRTKTPANALVKPIYKPEGIRSAQVHHNILQLGRSINAPDEGLRMNHYWGARLQNWGEDTPEILAKTTEDLTVRPIVEAVLDCEACLPENNMLRFRRWN